VALHLRVARERSRHLPLEAVLERASACRELLAQGLLPDQLRDLEAHGLSLGDPRRPRSLAALVDHLAAYLAAVEAAGYLEPEVALWRAVDAEQAGRRGLWIEREAADGPLDAGWRDLVPARLRALTTLPRLGAVRVSLATRRGDGSSGLFGSEAPSLSAWLMEGLEHHGATLANEVLLDAPQGWAEACPWGAALEGLFEGPLQLGEAAQALRRALVPTPFDLLLGAVEQACAWVEEGVAPRDIVLVHPDPAAAGPLLKECFAAEGLALQVRGAPPSLHAHRVWAPLFAVVEGLAAEDPCRVAAGLQASPRRDLRSYAEALAASDQVGASSFEAALQSLEEGPRDGVARAVSALRAWPNLRLSPRIWAERLGQAATSLRLAEGGDPFFGALGLLKEGWEAGGSWTFEDMREGLEGFLRTATDPGEAKDPTGLRLIPPSGVLEPGFRCRAALALDLREGQWPAAPLPNPDLDWQRRVAINRALLEQAAAGRGPAGFSPALQRFWLPLAEGTEQVPRLLQREAYAFNALLALTEEAFVALTPGQDEEGRPQAQGPFWAALEGAGAWSPDPARAASRLRWRREGAGPTPLQRARAEAAQARPASEWPTAAAPAADRIADATAAWLGAKGTGSPTALETLARCPFRAFAERAWGLRERDLAASLRMDRGTLAHRLLHAVLAPLVDAEDWPMAFRALLGEEAPSASSIEDHLAALWVARADAWLADLDTPPALWPRLRRELVDLLPNLAAYLLGELTAEAPTPREAKLLWPDRCDEGSKLPDDLVGGWRRRILGLEQALAPRDFGGFVVEGTVDRLERWTRGDLAFLRVLDYKTQKASRLAPFAEGDAPFRTHLQTPLYAALVGAERGLPTTALLVPLGEEEPEPWDKVLGVLGEAGDWQARLEASVRSLKDRLDRGDLPPTPGDHCEHCTLAALCGRPVDVVADEEGE
jgi:RecB family exonuclease